ncbi:MAG: HpaII family restriction endonuclease [Phascolarctobacterium sp.]|nr:HpaII family restriction endonuclease [Phascolarctobacterium sp.]
MTDKEVSLNKGEWSEIYAFMKLLKDGRIYAADEKLERLSESMYLPIIKIRREEKEDGIYDYYTADEKESIIKIFHNGQFIKEVSVEEFDVNAVCLYHTLTSSKTGNIKLNEVGNLKLFFEDIYVKQLKAKNTQKADIILEIIDVNTGFRETDGFSIKSQLGGPSTLLNASKATNWTYVIHGIDDAIMDQVNAIDTKNKIKDRMNLLRAVNAEIKFSEMKNFVFNDNLEMIDSRMPEIMSYILLYRYFDNITKSDELINCICERNPVGYRNNKIYNYKYKKLLCAAALGMLPSKEWDGIDEANGGYIIVKVDGDILAYYLRNRNAFEEYLLRTTKLEAASTERHDYAKIYKENGQYYMNLNLQIRFDA